jgi:hypothetical protein
LNDLWRYDGEEWVWLSGSKLRNQSGVYGEKGIPNSNNIPGGRFGAASWIDSYGNMWIFGGVGYSSNDNFVGNVILINY